MTHMLGCVSEMEWARQEQRQLLNHGKVRIPIWLDNLLTVLFLTAVGIGFGYTLILACYKIWNFLTG